VNRGRVAEIKERVERAKDAGEESETPCLRFRTPEDGTVGGADGDSEPHGWLTGGVISKRESRIRVTEVTEPLKPGVLEDRFARLGLANCRSLLRSADALAAIGQYGHALALVSLALEELETAHAYRLVADGIATFDPKEAHVLQFIDKRALVTHAPKLVLLGERMLSFFYMKQTAKVVRCVWGRKPTPEEVMVVMMGGDPKVSPEVKKVLDSPEVVKEGRAIKEDIQKLKWLKNRGLYVFEKDGRLTAPSDIP
jgi:AbiV family abortive infection protein